MPPRNADLSSHHQNFWEIHIKLMFMLVEMKN